MDERILNPTRLIFDAWSVYKLEVRSPQANHYRVRQAVSHCNCSTGKCDHASLLVLIIQIVRFDPAVFTLAGYSINLSEDLASLGVSR